MGIERILKDIKIKTRIKMSFIPVANTKEEIIELRQKYLAECKKYGWSKEDLIDHAKTAHLRVETSVEREIWANQDITRDILCKNCNTPHLANNIVDGKCPSCISNVNNKSFFDDGYIMTHEQWRDFALLIVVVIMEFVCAIIMSPEK